ncbi:unnamed protein product [Lactuca virosa]|uniref:PB1-like domain-containing protein n=1 Tax=Lactuca virosa TaxID=75947 RepID=A0AAU9N9V7_9ASTR|nr:unnamed protein product [Lactuca virosa]
MAFETVNWELRNSSEYLDLYELYGSENSKYFSMKINHGGSFLYYPERGYHGGIVDHVDFINITNFSLEVFQKIITSFGYDINKTFFYSLVSYAPLDVGLNNLENSKDIFEFLKKVKTDGFLCVQEIYLEHHHKTVSTFFPHILNLATNSYLCTQLYTLVASNPNVNVWEARINFFDRFNFWIDVHELREALEYIKFQVNLLRGNKVEM